MNLLVDIGNTRIKWAVENKSVLETLGAFRYRQAGLTDLLDEYWRSLPLPERVLVSNVAGDDIRDILSEWVINNWKLNIRVATVERFACGVTNAYHDVNQLGVDRWLAVIAAWDRFKTSACVIDCGTAITIDGITFEGSHMGGLIIPGLAMMQETLIKNTLGIDVDIDSQTKLEFGRDTQSGVSNGCSFAAVALIDRVVKSMYAKTGDSLKCVITGGAAQFIIPLLETEFIIDTELVLHGLSTFFRDQP
jgi:type III pantothenate kinase